DAGLFRPGAVARLTGKIEGGARLGETDDMAVAGIVSTQLLHHLFVKNAPRPLPLGPQDPVKVCRLNAHHREVKS
ncbi:MAG: asparagine synthetase B, partial [Elusimicrobia bacterium]|nr:asparagine synthetase B [Elusimicrobiota bacterium]